MKIYRKTLITCFCAFCIVAIAIALCEYCHCSATITNILIGIMSSALIVCITSVVGYLHEKSILMQRTDKYLLNTYLNLLVVKDITGNLIASKNLDTKMLDGRLKLLCSITQTIKTQGDNTLLSEYSSLVCSKNDIMQSILSDTSSFMRKNSALDSKLQDLTILNLQYAVFLSQVEIEKTKGGELTQDIINHDTDFQKTIIVKMSKIHEFEASLVVENDKIATLLDTKYCFTSKWQSKKAMIESEANQMLSSYLH